MIIKARSGHTPEATMVWRFLKQYGLSKAHDVLDDFAAAVATFDPATASKAQLAVMQAEHSKLARRLAEAEAEVRREHRETEELRANYNQLLAAAKLLEAKLTTETDSATRTEMEMSLSKTVDKLERMKPEIQREEQEDRQVEEWRTELRNAFEEMGQKIRGARLALTSAQREMEMARLQQQRTAQQEEKSLTAAGVTGAIGSLSVALDAMNRETAKVRAETEAARLQADLIQGDRLELDPNIAKALAEVRGTPESCGSLLSERLSALSIPEHPGSNKNIHSAA